MLETAQTDIELWLVDDREVADTALLERYHQLLNAEESARHQRFIFTRHRHQFLVSRALVRSVLAQYLGLAPAAVAFSKNIHGKPQLSPQTALYFNLTHTNGLVALAVTRSGPVGIHVEFLSRQADIVKLTGRYFARDEASALFSLPVSDWNQRFYDLWTLKEAYLKACGTGLATPLGDFSFGFPGKGISISFSNAIKDDPAAWQFWQLDVDGAWRLSLALNAGMETACAIRARKGIPLGEFEGITLPVLRQSL